MFHLAAKVAGLDVKARDAFCRFEGKTVELARVDKHAERKLLAVLLQDVFVAGHGPARGLYESLGYTALPGVRYLRLLD